MPLLLAKHWMVALRQAVLNSISNSAMLKCLQWKTFLQDGLSVSQNNEEAKSIFKCLLTQMQTYQNDKSANHQAKRRLVCMNLLLSCKAQITVAFKG